MSTSLWGLKGSSETNLGRRPGILVLRNLDIDVLICGEKSEG